MKALLISRHLTGDSEILFFENEQEAITHFNNLVKPLLKILSNYGIKPDGDDDEVYYGTHELSIRFRTGYNSEIDGILLDSDLYLEVVDVPEWATHYFVQWAEWVDETEITFCHSSFEAIGHYEIMVRANIEGINTETAPHIVLRHDETTHCEEMSHTYFSEDATMDNAYFGYTDCSWTFQWGVINTQLKSMQYDVILTNTINSITA